MSTQAIWLNSMALGWFALLWLSYNWLSQKISERQEGLSLNKLAKNYRIKWMQQMLARENRIVDATLLNTLLRSVSFFLSGTILVIAGLYAALGAAEDIHAMTEHIPFAEITSIPAVKSKILLLIGIFVYVFFKLAWSLRQFNFSLSMLGAAPPNGTDDAEKQRYAEKIGFIIDRAGRHFNEGMRGFEFGLAYLAWFIHPLALVLSTSIVTAVIYRREHRSATLHAMQRWEQGK